MRGTMPKQITDKPTGLSEQPPDMMLVFGFILLPQDYTVERDVVVTLVGVMSLISVIVNAILLLVIIKDPFKQLRTITAILLAFSSAANLCISLVLLLDSVLFWSHRTFFPELVVYLGACTSSLYSIGNLLHTLDIYTTIIVPVRYAYWAPKVRKLLVKLLSFIWIITTCVIVIPPYVLPKRKVPSFLKGILTLVCVQFTLLTLTFVCLYTRIFQALYARKRRLGVSFNIDSSTPQGRRVMKRNFEVAKTLFIHVLFFVVATLPASVVVMITIHCATCCNPTSLQVATLFTVPCIYISFVFHPLLWLFRLNSYRLAMKQTLSFRSSQSKSCNNDPSIEKKRKRLGAVSTITPS